MSRFPSLSVSTEYDLGEGSALCPSLHGLLADILEAVARRLLLRGDREVLVSNDSEGMRLDRRRRYSDIVVWMLPLGC
jgi:hypothetical protein